MYSKMYAICNWYRFGYNHGLKNDGFDLSKPPLSDPEQEEAFQLGYEAGLHEFSNIRWPIFGCDSDEVCELCDAKPTKVEPLYHYVTCKECSKLSPDDFNERRRQKEKSFKWSWVMSYCKLHNLAPARKSNWKRAEQAFIHAHGDQ